MDGDGLVDAEQNAREIKLPHRTITRRYSVICITEACMRAYKVHAFVFKPNGGCNELP
jgi:hypothetical protein